MEIRKDASGGLVERRRHRHDQYRKVLVGSNWGIGTPLTPFKQRIYFEIAWSKQGNQRPCVPKEQGQDERTTIGGVTKPSRTEQSDYTPVTVQPVTAHGHSNRGIQQHTTSRGIGSFYQCHDERQRYFDCGNIESTFAHLGQLRYWRGSCRGGRGSGRLWQQRPHPASGVLPDEADPAASAWRA